LSFEVNEKITLDGNLPDGSHYSTVIKSAGIVALIVMKAHAMDIRKKSKDAYDISLETGLSLCNLFFSVRCSFKSKFFHCYNERF